jgi:hypothetical protein
MAAPVARRAQRGSRVEGFIGAPVEEFWIQRMRVEGNQ